MTIRPGGPFDAISRAWQDSEDLSVRREIDGTIVEIAPAPPDQVYPLERLRVLDDGTVWGLTPAEPTVSHWNGGAWEILDASMFFPTPWTSNAGDVDLAVRANGEVWIVFPTNDFVDATLDSKQLCRISPPGACEALPIVSPATNDRLHVEATDNEIWLFSEGDSFFDAPPTLHRRADASTTWEPVSLDHAHSIVALRDAVIVSTLDIEGSQESDVLFTGTAMTVLSERALGSSTSSIAAASSAALWQVSFEEDSDPGACSFSSTWDLHCSGGTLYWSQFVVYRWDGTAFAEVAHLTFGQDEYAGIGAVVPSEDRLLLVNTLDGLAWSTP